MTASRTTLSRRDPPMGFGMGSSDRGAACLDQCQPASGEATLSEMSPCSSGVDSAWKYGLVCLVMDHPGGV
jgi:hypothetical protein